MKREATCTCIAYIPYNIMDPVTDHIIPSKPWGKQRPPRKILAIRLQAMGDTIITLPYLQALRNSLPPGTTIDLLTREEVDPVPRSLELFDQIYSIRGGRNFKKQLVWSALLLPRLLWKRYDVVLDLQNNLISRVVRKAIRPAAWSQFDKYSPRAAGERTRLTVEAAGLATIVACNRFELKPQPGLTALLIKNGWNGSKLVVLNPAAAFTTRNWPIENYVAFAKLWLQQFPYTQFLVIGTSFIETKAHYLKKELGEQLIDLVGQTSPATAFAAIQLASFVLSEDSGLMHMAWVSGIPVMVLFGGTRSDWSRPLGAHSCFVDSSDLPCGNCMLAECPYGDVHCLTRFTPQQIFRQAMEHLQHCPQPPTT